MKASSLLVDQANPGQVERSDDRGLRRSLAKALLLVVLATGAMLFLVLSGEILTSKTLDEWIGGFGPWAGFVFVGVGMLGIGLGAPRFIFACLGGALFGSIEGIALAQVATIVGCCLAFSVGRWLSREPVERLLRSQLERARAVLDFIGKHGVAANIGIRFLPYSNCWVTNLVFSVSSVSLPRFVVGTFVGTLPVTVICGLIGSGVSSHSAKLWLTGALALVGLTVASWLLARHSRLGRGITATLLRGSKTARGGEPSS